MDGLLLGTNIDRVFFLRGTTYYRATFLPRPF